MQHFHGGVCGGRQRASQYFRIGALLAWLLIGCLGMEVVAQSRCDCRELIGDCEATATYKDGLLEVTSNTAACAQVLYYIDGQPKVRLVTDGRDVKPESIKPTMDLQTGSCRICKSVEVSRQQKRQVIQACDEQYLMPTQETKQCLSTCTDLPDNDERAVCEHACQQHSRCLDKNCVQSLSQQLALCEKRCDREMQSSMAADIDAYQTCQNNCSRIKQEILTCPLI